MRQMDAKLHDAAFAVARALSPGVKGDVVVIAEPRVTALAELGVKRLPLSSLRSRR
jgi:hypothetical protein